MELTTIPNDAIAIQALAVAVDTLKATANGAVIIRAAGVTAGNVYTSFQAGLAAAYAAGPGVVIYIDGDVTAEAVTYNFTNARFEGLGGGVPTVTFPVGSSAVWDTSAAARDFEIRNVAFSWQGSSPFIEIPAEGLYVVMDLTSSITSSPGALAPFIHAASAGGDLTINVNYGCTIGLSGRRVVTMDTGRVATLVFQQASTLAPNVLGGTGDFLVIDATAGLTATSILASVSRTQTGVTGTITFDPP